MKVFAMIFLSFLYLTFFKEEIRAQRGSVLDDVRKAPFMLTSCTNLSSVVWWKEQSRIIVTNLVTKRSGQLTERREDLEQDKLF